METKPDRRIRKTKALLRAGLAKLMNQKSVKEITVKELVDEVDINRSTFYLHYTDIYNMLETLENELLKEITTAIEENPVSPFSEKSFPFLKEIFEILEENRDLCCALLGPNGDIAFLERIEQVLSEKCLGALRDHLKDDLGGLKYSYAFCLSGCIGLVKLWLTEENEQSAEHIAELTFQFIMSVVAR